MVLMARQNEEKDHAKPQEEFINLADYLQKWLDEDGDKDLPKEEVDAVMEWLNDNGCLNKKGKAVAYAYWHKNVHKA